MSGASDAARKTLCFARYEASRLGFSAIAPEHLLLGVCRTGDETALDLLRRFGLAPDAVRRDLAGQRSCAGPVGAAPSLPLADESRRVLKMAAEEARAAPAQRAGVACLILALLRLEEGPAPALLRRHGVTLDAARREVRTLAGAAFPHAPAAGRNLPLLAEYGRDLTETAARGGFDPLIGRESELERIIQILCQRLKRSLILLGEPGVGKTALVEGLAQRIAEGKVPAPLGGQRIVALDLAAIVAGTRYRGELEERLRGILGELRQARDRIVFIDEIHSLVGAGAAEGALGAANILKPALAQGEISCIGATTLKEYRQHIERDRALQRRFQPVEIHPPSAEQVLCILEGVKSRYEEFHGVRYTEAALRAAVLQTARYLPERQFPDKAIEALDQAGAMVKLRAARDGAPPEVGRDEIDQVVARATGIPVARLGLGESERLRRLEETLAARVVGQPEAVRALSQAVRRSRLGLRDRRRPIGSFLLAGPPGVGKTESARRLAEILFDRAEALLRFDMSEYMERHSVAKLIGSPPGYVGYEEGGRLTEAVRRQPYCVLLFDEIEKAHADLAGILLQILEEGCLTDSQGQRVDFTHTVVLITSNVGSRRALEARGIGFGGDARTHLARMRTEAGAELRRAFSPELLDRLDEVILFNPLSGDDLRAVLDLVLADLDLLLRERGLTVEIGEEARVWLLERARLDEATGARSLRRTVRRWLQDAISERLIDAPDDVPLALRVEAAADGLDVKVEQAGRSSGPAAGAINGVEDERSREPA